MLRVTIQSTELFDETTETFTNVDDVELELEHSLVSLSKWESFFQKPFLSSTEKTPIEILTYIRMMVLTPNVDPTVYLRLSQQNVDDIHAYIDSSQSATTFGDMPKRSSNGEIITSELIYYWLIAFSIPFECQTWHLNRLFALVRICNIKNSKPKKMSKQEMAQRNRELNAQRKAKLNTSG